MVELKTCVIHTVTGKTFCVRQSRKTMMKIENKQFRSLREGGRRLQVPKLVIYGLKRLYDFSYFTLL